MSTTLRPRADGADVLVVLAAVACVVVAQVLQIISPYSATVSATTVALGSAASVVDIVVGLIIRRQRPGNIVGPILIAIGFLRWIPTIEFIDHPLPWTLSNVFRLSTLPLAAHLYVAFPGSRPLRGIDRRVVLAAYAVWLTTAFGRVMFFDTADPAVCTGCPANLLLVDPDQRLSVVVAAISTVLAVVLALAVGWRVWRHWMNGSEAGRRALVPAIITAPISIIDVFLYLSATWIATTAAYAFLNGPAYQLLRLAVPVVLLAGVLRTQLDRTAVSGLLVDIGGAPGIASMQAALRRTLHDGSIRLLAWSVGAGAWVDEDGVAQPLPSPTERVAVTRIERPGQPLAVVIHDPTLTEEPALLTAATAALQLAFDNERLTATVSAQAELAASLPTGRVTLLYADIEGSTGLLAQLGEAYVDLLAEERGLLRRVVRAWRGREIDARADEFFAVFPSASDAAAAALAITRRMRTQSWPQGAEVRVRIGLHTGEPARSPDGYVGLDVHRAARIANAGHGGQIVVSATTEAAIRDAPPADARLSALGHFQLRGLPDPDELFQLSAPDLPSAFPAPRTASDVRRESTPS